MATLAATSRWSMLGAEGARQASEEMRSGCLGCTDGGGARPRPGGKLLPREIRCRLGFSARI